MAWSGVLFVAGWITLRQEQTTSCPTSLTCGRCTSRTQGFDGTRLARRLLSLAGIGGVGGGGGGVLELGGAGVIGNCSISGTIYLLVKITCFAVFERALAAVLEERLLISKKNGCCCSRGSLSVLEAHLLLFSFIVTVRGRRAGSSNSGGRRKRVPGSNHGNSLLVYGSMT